MRQKSRPPKTRSDRLVHCFVRTTEKGTQTPRIRRNLWTRCQAIKKSVCGRQAKFAANLFATCIIKPGLHEPRLDV